MSIVFQLGSDDWLGRHVTKTVFLHFDQQFIFHQIRALDSKERRVDHGFKFEIVCQSNGCAVFVLNDDGKQIESTFHENPQIVPLSYSKLVLQAILILLTLFKIKIWLAGYILD